MTSTNRFNLTRSRALRWLDDLPGREVAFTLYIEPGTGRVEIEKLLAQALDRGETLDALAEKAVASPTGAAIFYQMSKSFVIWPPFPLAGGGLHRCCEPAPFRSMLEKDWQMGLVLVRLGRYSVGVFQGEKLLAGKAGTGLVHARHHKGGSSANRFARHREKQMEYFFTRVEGHAREILAPYVRSIDYIMYGGTRDTLLRMWKQCAFFESLRPKTVDRLIALREPRRSTFDDALEEAYMSTVYEVTV
ncbi:MAG: Vms1/Ankzf1 family peptidyl-tRNA hydrolase [Chloroflexi bacterium]|nr:Vms1/Ankzf1 family peptidyl-tRNA hydrolase [Chloroflexota bacterium]